MDGTLTVVKAGSKISHLKVSLNHLKFSPDVRSRFTEFRLIDSYESLSFHKVTLEIVLWINHKSNLHCNMSVVLFIFVGFKETSSCSSVGIKH